MKRLVHNCSLFSLTAACSAAEACEFGTQTSGVLKKLKADKNHRLALLHKETFQQVSARKIAFAEQVLVERSVSEAFDEEKQFRQHSNDQHTGCICASHGM